MAAMTKRIRSITIFMILSLAAVILWGNAVYYGQYLEQHYQSVSIRLKEGKVSEEAIIKALKNEQDKASSDIPSVTAWNIYHSESIGNSDIGSEAAVQVLEVYGDLGMVYPIELADGTVPFIEDAYGCLADEATVFELFGTKEAVGSLITFRGREYCVTGVIKAEEQVLLIHASEEINPAVSYANLELKYADPENELQKAYSFMNDNSLAYNYTVIDGCFYSEVTNILYHIPAWLLGLLVIFMGMKQIWIRRRKPILLLALSVPLIAFTIAVLWLAEIKLTIPERLIPTKWSDFSFWAERYKSIVIELRNITHVMPLPRDMIFMRTFNSCIISWAAAMAGFLLVIILSKKTAEDNNSLVLSIMAVFIELSAIIILFRTGKEFQSFIGFLCMFPLFLLASGFKAEVSKIHNTGIKE